MTPMLTLEEDEEPMATEPIYLSSDESKNSTPNTTPDHQHESFYADSFNQLIASQLEQGSNMGTNTVFYLPTPNTSMTSNDEEQSNLTPIIRNPEQHKSQIPQQRNHPKQLCQFLQTVTDTPESPPPEDRGQKDIFRPYHVLDPSTSASYSNPPPPMSRQWLMGFKIWLCNPIRNAGTQGVGDAVFGLQKIKRPGYRKNCCRLSQPDSSTRWDSTRTPNQKKCFHWWYWERSIHFSSPGYVTGCHMRQLDLLCQSHWTQPGHAGILLAPICWWKWQNSH